MPPFTLCNKGDVSNKVVRCSSGLGKNNNTLEVVPDSDLLISKDFLERVGSGRYQSTEDMGPKNTTCKLKHTVTNNLSYFLVIYLGTHTVTAGPAVTIWCSARLKYIYCARFLTRFLTNTHKVRKGVREWAVADAHKLSLFSEPVDKSTFMAK